MRYKGKLSGEVGFEEAREREASEDEVERGHAGVQPCEKEGGVNK